MPWHSTTNRGAASADEARGSEFLLHRTGVRPFCAQLPPCVRQVGVKSLLLADDEIRCGVRRPVWPGIVLTSADPAVRCSALSAGNGNFAPRVPPLIDSRLARLSFVPRSQHRVGSPSSLTKHLRDGILASQSRSMSRHTPVPTANSIEIFDAACPSLAATRSDTNTDYPCRVRAQRTRAHSPRRPPPEPTARCVMTVRYRAACFLRLGSPGSLCTIHQRAVLSALLSIRRSIPLRGSLFAPADCAAAMCGRSQPTVAPNLRAWAARKRNRTRISGPCNAEGTQAHAVQSHAGKSAQAPLSFRRPPAPRSPDRHPGAQKCRHVAPSTGRCSPSR